MASHYSKLVHIAKYGLDPYTILKNARQEIRAGGTKTKKDCQELESYLQSIFYGKHKTDLVRVSNLVTKSLEEKHQRVFDNYDFAANTATSLEENVEGKIEANSYFARTHSKRINYDTIEQRWAEAIAQLNKLASSSDPTKKFQEIKTQLEQLISLTEAILQRENETSTTGGGTQIFRLQENPTIAHLVDAMDDLYAQLVYYNNLPLTLQESGEVFEKALKLVGTGKQINDIADDELAELFNEKTLGQAIASRGQLINYSCSVKEKNLVKKNKNGTTSTSIKYTVSGDNGSIYTLQGEFAKKQGKMDVSITMPGANGTSPFRVSAKNWSNINSQHDFGETSIEDALIRTAGLDPTLAYGVALYGRDIEQSTLAKAHNYAKVCILVDILMGYSQKENYADTIIINNRSIPAIKVYSIYTILSNIDFNNFKLIGYNDNSIQKGIQDSMNVGWPNYIASILNVLKTYKVKVGTNILYK